MLTESLKELGISTGGNIPISELLSENFNGSLHGLNDRQMKRIHALRDIISEYAKARTLSMKASAITNSGQAAEILGPAMRTLEHEEAWAIFLNNNNSVIKTEMLSSGTQTSTMLSVKSIVSKALSLSACGIILAHNHPSGIVTPSKEDIKRTEALKKACETMELYLTDHLIISGDSYYSFSDEQTHKF